MKIISRDKIIKRIEAARQITKSNFPKNDPYARGVISGYSTVQRMIDEEAVEIEDHIQTINELDIKQAKRYIIFKIFVIVLEHKAYCIENNVVVDYKFTQSLFHELYQLYKENCGGELIEAFEKMEKNRNDRTGTP